MPRKKGSRRNTTKRKHKRRAVMMYTRVHHHRHIEPHAHKKKGRPRGISVLISYSLILAVFYLILGTLVPTTIIMGRIIEGPVSYVLNFALAIAIFTMVHGFYRRWYGVWKLSLIVYALSIINSFISIFHISDSIFKAISGFMVTSFVFTILLNLLTLWYLVSKRDYFLHHHKDYSETTMEDKVFVSAIYLFYFFSILMIIAIGFELYKSITLNVDELVDELNGKTYAESLSLCASKSEDKRDVCYMTVAAIYKSYHNSITICNRIEDKFYRFTCTRSL